ncbi:MAG: tRNA dihydrouridine synthase DusB [Alphaproteobacteria bacterium]|nr:tRNA dihydrouridine synthase DusB [Alphaproteobacteria bacterium]
MIYKENSIKLGKLEVPHRVFLSPMADITDIPFRRQVRKFGCGMMYTEMVYSTSVLYSGEVNMRKRKILDEERPMGIQLVGTDAVEMGIAAKIAYEEDGASLIDINMGCPSKKINKNLSGAGLMRDLDKASDIISSVIEAVEIPISVKMRLGWDDDNLNALELCKIAEKLGASNVTIHGRTRNQGYRGDSNWDAIGDIASKVNIPVIGNGDITSIEKAVESIKSGKVDGIMVGRGSLGRPWFIDQIIHYIEKGEVKPDPSETEKREVILSHFIDMLDYYGETRGIKLFRKHLCWYASGYRNGKKLKLEANICEDKNRIIELIKDFWNK